MPSVLPAAEEITHIVTQLVLQLATGEEIFGVSMLMTVVTTILAPMGLVLLYRNKAEGRRVVASSQRR